MQGDSKSVALCVALGGSSDIIGVVVLARAAGYGRVVLLQPGSPAKGSAHTSSVQCSRVEPQSPPLVAPGGGYYDNGSMVAYLLAVLPEAEAGYYLTQPKDDVGGGFSRAALDASIEAITQLGADHGCTAVLGVDLGGDAALERSAPSDCAPFIPERDRLNLRAARRALGEHGGACTWPTLWNPFEFLWDPCTIHGGPVPVQPSAQHLTRQSGSLPARSDAAWPTCYSHYSYML